MCNHDSQSFIANTHDGHTKPSAPGVVILLLLHGYTMDGIYSIFDIVDKLASRKLVKGL